MTIKPVITQKQAVAIEYGSKNHPRNRLIEAYLQRANLGFTGKLLPLRDMNYDQFFGSLYGGYEVEPEFGVGDWVTRTKTRPMFECEKHWEKGYVFQTNLLKSVSAKEKGSIRSHSLDSLRHATNQEIAQEKERRASKKIDELLLSLSTHERVLLHERMNCREGGNYERN